MKVSNNHHLIPLPHRRSSRHQFERTTTPNASIGFTTPSISITCKLASIFHLMRSSIRGNNKPIYTLGSVGFLALPFSPKRPGKTAVEHNSIIHPITSSNNPLISCLRLSRLILTVLLVQFEIQRTFVQSSPSRLLCDDHISHQHKSAQAIINHHHLYQVTPIV